MAPTLIPVTITMTKAQLNDAVRQWVIAAGFEATDNLDVCVTVTPGDRPYDRESTDITVTGVVMAAPNPQVRK